MSDLYAALIDSHTSSTEAGYARTQIFNIASQSVARDALLLSHLELARAALRSARQPGPT